MFQNFYAVAVLAVLFFSVKLFALPALDQDFECFTAEQAERYVQDFNVDIGSFGGRELCDARIDSKKLLNDFSVVEQGQFQDDTSQLLIKGFIPSTGYYSWLKAQTYGVSRGNDIPYATAYNSGGFFTMQDGWSLLSTLGRVGTLIHEARHTEGYRHIICNQGPYRNSSVSGCDENYNYGGSHAIEMEYYARVAVLGKNFHPLYKTMARLMALARSNFVFNETPIQSTQTLVGLTPDGQLFVRAHDRWLPRQAPQFQGHLKTTSYGAAIYNSGQAYAVDLYERGTAQVDVADNYSYYKLLRSHRSDVNDIDFEELDLGNKRYVFSLGEDGQLYKYVFSSGGWTDGYRLETPATRIETVSPQGQKGLFVVADNGDILQINPERPEQQKRLAEKWPADLARVVFWQNKPLQHRANGSLEGFQNVLFSQVVNAPLYNAFEVHPE